MDPPAILRAIRAKPDNPFAIGEYLFGKQDKVGTLDNDSKKETAKQGSAESARHVILFVPFDCLFTDRH